MKVAYGLIIAVALGGSVGCKKMAQMIAEKVSEKAGEALSSTTEDPAQESVGYYNKGFNLLIDDPQKTIEEYYDKIPKDGPEANQKYTLFPRHTFAESKLPEIKKAFADGARTAPEPLKHLGPLADVCYTDIEKVITAFKAAHQYYDAEDFKDDKGAKGKVLHADFVRAADAYEADIKKFEDALSVIEEKQMAEELKKFDKDKSYGYWFRSFNQDANRLLKADKEHFTAGFATIEKDHEGITAFLASKPDAQPAYKSYVGQTDNFFTVAKKLKRAVEDKNSKGDEASDLHSNLIDAYNNMIGVSNSLRELEANGLLK